MPTTNNKRRTVSKSSHAKRGQLPESRQGDKFKISALTQKRAWATWVSHLEKRRRPAPLRDLVPGSSIHPLKWAITPAYFDSPTQSLVRTLIKSGAGKRTSIRHALEQLQPWLESTEAADPSELFALECLAWCHASTALAAECDAAEWVALIERLRDVCTSAVAIAVQEQPLEHQLLSGELGLTLSYLYPELSGNKKVQRTAERSLSYGVSELLDGEGLPQCRYFQVFRQLLACWTRCSVMSGESGGQCFDSESQLQYEWVIRQAIALARPDGTQLFSPGGKTGRHTDLFVAAIQHGGDAADEAAAERALPGQHFKSDSHVERSLPESSVHSSWGEASIMRPKWARKSPLLGVTWGERLVNVELVTSSELLWSGTWGFEVKVDSQLLEPTSDWDVVCWHSDADVDYLEIEADLGPDCRLQRQLILGKLDQFLFLADAVLGSSTAEIEYECELPLQPDVQFHTDDETREGILWKQKPLASVLPISLPEWRLTATEGGLVVEDGVLQHSRRTTAKNLYAPLFFDLSQRRLPENRTWRQLTIAEQLEIQPADVAVGYRVQLGPHTMAVLSLVRKAGQSDIPGTELVQ